MRYTKMPKPIPFGPDGVPGCYYFQSREAAET